MFSRQGLYDRLGVSLGLISEKAIEDLIFRGVVRPVARTTRNQPIYNEETVEKALESIREDEARKHRPPDHFNSHTFSTEDSLAVFAGLEAGKTLIQIALESKIDPRYVEVIAAKYCKQSGAMFLSKEEMKRLNAKIAPLRVLFDEDGQPVKPDPITTGGELVDVILALQPKKTCIRCRKAEKCEECEACVIRKIERAIHRQMAASAPEAPGSDVVAASLPPEEVRSSTAAE
jgi:hypothetical protein